MSDRKRFVDITSLKLYDTLLKKDMDEKIKSGIAESEATSIQSGDYGFTTGDQVYNYVAGLSEDFSIDSIDDDDFDYIFGVPHWEFINGKIYNYSFSETPEQNYEEIEIFFKRTISGEEEYICRYTSRYLDENNQESIIGYHSDQKVTLDSQGEVIEWGDIIRGLDPMVIEPDDVPPGVNTYEITVSFDGFSDTCEVSVEDHS